MDDLYIEEAMEAWRYFRPPMQYKNQELYTFAMYFGWSATLFELLYGLMNLSWWNAILVVSELLLTSHEMLREFGEDEFIKAFEYWWSDWEDHLYYMGGKYLHEIIEPIFYTFYATEYMI